MIHRFIPIAAFWILNIIVSQVSISPTSYEQYWYSQFRFVVFEHEKRSSVKMLVKSTLGNFRNDHDENSPLAHQFHLTLHPSLFNNQNYNSTILAKANDTTSG